MLGSWSLNVQLSPLYCLRRVGPQLSASPSLVPRPHQLPLLCPSQRPCHQGTRPRNSGTLYVGVGGILLSPSASTGASAHLTVSQGRTRWQLTQWWASSVPTCLSGNLVGASQLPLTQTTKEFAVLWGLPICCGLGCPLGQLPHHQSGQCILTLHWVPQDFSDLLNTKATKV